MRLGQIKPEGGVIAAVFEGDAARPIPAHTMVDLISRAEAEGLTVPELASQLASRHAEAHAAVLPIHPREVWGCGCMYKGSPLFRQTGAYKEAFRRERPMTFFKGTARVCVGPGMNIGMRADSKRTAPEPELAVVLGSRGAVVGYTLANDVTAWDLEAENPLYMAQAKIYQRSCALGPAIVTADQMPEPYKLEMTCTIERAGKVVFSDSVSTAGLQRRLDVLIEYLLRSNPVPAGSVLLTGTGIVMPEGASLVPDDVVSIRIPEVGELSNRVTPV
jgi:2-dehydro-3-deoxy-D-arabinonate dehydratase